MIIIFQESIFLNLPQRMFKEYVKKFYIKGLRHL